MGGCVLGGEGRVGLSRGRDGHLGSCVRRIRGSIVVVGGGGGI